MLQSNLDIKFPFYEFIFILLFGLVRASFHVCLSNITIHYGETSKNNSSIIVDLFQGQLRSTTKCKKCKGESVRVLGC